MRGAAAPGEASPAGKRNREAASARARSGFVIGGLSRAGAERRARVYGVGSDA
ncbi:hypothetical protein Ms3S1_26700 [Methylosinus sp. 3S-1]